MALGVWLIFAAAVCGGTFTLPMKYVRRFQWENTWLWGSFFTMVVLPWIVAMFLLPQPFSTVFGAGRALAIALAFGFGWGLGTVTFGIGINRIGLSLGYAIVMGVNTALGSLLPMIVLSPADIHTGGGHTILFGILICIIGVFTCGYAGLIKEREGSQAAVRASSNRFRGTILQGMLICVLSGVLSAFMNLGFSFSQGIGHRAYEHGASESLAGLATWIAVFAGSFPAVLLCCAWLQFRRKSYRKNLGPGSTRDVLLTFVLGLLWFGAIFLYGLGAFRLGRIGTSVGWAINISASLLVANLLGFVTGEWRRAPRRSIQWIVSGLVIVIASMGILAYGNALLARAGSAAG